jgi:uncharacterized membrane protein HdeD (DUF308 family)
VSAGAQDRSAVLLTVEAAGIWKNWGWFLALGIVQIIAGTLAVDFVLSATVAFIATLGILLLIAGVAQTAAALLARDWDGFFLFMLLGLLYGVAGFLTIEQLLFGTESLSLMLAVLFLLVGLFRIAFALVDHLPSSGWVLFNGVVTVLLGVATWRLGPRSGVRVLSLLVGIEVIVNGVTWSVLAVVGRSGLARSSGQ